MKDRKERLARAVVIGDKLWRLQQMRLSAAKNELAALRAAEAAAFESLAHIEPSLILPRIADLARQRLDAEQALLEARERARDYGRRLKLSEKLHKKADEIAQREETRSVLADFPTRSDVSAG